MANRQGNGEASRQVHRGLIKTVRPSPEAAELSALLGRPYDWAALQAATKSFEDFANPAEINRQIRADLRQSKLYGPKREAKFQELRTSALAEKRREWDRLRAIAWDLHHLTALYGRHRGRILGLPEADRPAAAKELVRAYLDPDPTALRKLEGLSEKQIARRRADIATKRRQRTIAFEMDRAGLKSAPRKPMTKMLFPRSAANPLRAIEEYRRDVREHWRRCTHRWPALKNMDPSVATAIVLSDTKFLRPDDQMWHSRKAACVGSNTSDKKEGDD